MTTPESSHRPMDPDGPTGKLCTWVENMSLDRIPENVRTRAKYLILDGLACGLVGAHLPWSEKAANAIFEMEPEGDSSVMGWNKGLSPLQAALLNSTFIQGFELDDWHSEAPLHSNSILLPALFAAAEHLNKLNTNDKITGSDFLTAIIVGYEIGPRVGNGLYGADMLTRGWHSGTVFGPAAASTAAAKLMRLPADRVEDALGIACTQACGLMSAQFESEVKRMQHGFAARNGLLGALLARSGYIGIKKVLEREYGGFLGCFGQGSGKDPPYLVEEVTKELGDTWKLHNICLKPYAAMAANHPTVDCVRGLQENHADALKDLSSITGIRIKMGGVAFHHGGFEPTRPITPVGAQMSAKYVCATQLLDHAVLPSQFRTEALDRDELWELVNKTTCEHDVNRPNEFAQEVTITFQNNTSIKHSVTAAKGVNPPLSNQDILNKWRNLVSGVVDDNQRMRKIEEVVLQIEQVNDIAALVKLLAPPTKNPIA